jgi:outer membrane protein
VDKKIHQTYGERKGYSYIYGTGDAASVLYAEDKYDITKDIKALNDKYKTAAKTEEKVEEKAEVKTEENKFLFITIKNLILELEWGFGTVLSV